MLGRRGALRFLALPPYLWLAVFFVLPVLLIVAISFRPEAGPIDFGDPWTFSLAQYQRIWETPAYLRRLGMSVGMALAIAASATLLAYPIAYFLAFRARERAVFFLILLLIPFAVSYLLRVMAWRLMLGGEGAINSIFQWLGITSAPIDLLLYSPVAVVITLIYVWIPFAALPIYAALQRIERGHLEAAADLGAGPWSRFWRVTVPLSLPGAIAAFFMVFIPTVGEYVTPSLVGGTEGYMYGNIIQDFFTRAASWATGSALSVIMLLLTLVLVAVALRLIDVRRLAS
ncbi:MAG TPA: ABC transporter permease [Candidatus Dormibacteraeota bacterium]|nr:ABC transporter permease [Candidatus Dormibacteraeota bacterium]